MDKVVLDTILPVSGIKDERTKMVAETLILACSYYLFDCVHDDKYANLDGLFRMVFYEGTCGRYSNSKTPLNKLFNTLPPDSYARKCYETFKRYPVFIREEAVAMLCTSFLIDELDDGQKDRLINLMKNKLSDREKLEREKENMLRDSFKNQERRQTI